MPKKVKDRLSAPQFYQACEALKKHKAEFMVGKLSLPDAAKKLGEITGLVISVSTMRQLKATTGIEWKTHRGKTNFRNISNRNNVSMNGVHLPINPH